VNDFQQFLNEIIYPLFHLFGFMFRPIGMIALGYVAGAVTRHTLLHKLQMRFIVPLVFLGVVIMVSVMSFSRWSSPGSLGALGVGLLAGFLMAKNLGGEPEAEDGT